MDCQCLRSKAHQVIWEIMVHIRALHLNWARGVQLEKTSTSPGTSCNNKVTSPRQPVTSPSTTRLQVRRAYQSEVFSDANFGEFIDFYLNNILL